MKKILICTGGTGGHIFPVIALTEYLKKKNFDIELITDFRAKKFINNASSKYFTFINVKTPTGKKGLDLSPSATQRLKVNIVYLDVLTTKTNTKQSKNFFI